MSQQEQILSDQILTTKKDDSAFQTYKRLLKSLRPYVGGFIVAILGIVMYAVIDGTFFKYLIPNLIDKGFVASNPEFLQKAPLYILGLFLLRGMATFFTTYFMGYVGRSVVRDFRCKMLKHMMRLPVSFFQSRPAGDLISKINYDAEQVASSLSNAISDTLRGFFLLISLVVVMFSISWRITIIVMLVAPILGVYFKYISNRMRKYSFGVQETMGDVTKVAGEIVQGYTVVKSFGAMDYETARVEKVTNKNRKQELRMFFATASSIPLMQFIGASALSLLVFLATTDTIKLTAGEFTGIFSAMLNLLRPIKQVAAVNSVLQRGIAAAQSIFGLLDELPEPDFGKIEVKRVNGKIDFNHVYFNYKSYNDSTDKSSTTSNPNNFVVKDLNFTINPGEVVALVGHSGSGKSTLASLLPRFHDIDHGKILIDNVDIRDYKIDSLRDQIALVSQEVTLFNDTILNNIAYGIEEQYTEAQIDAAVKAAFVDEFTDKLPEGMNTLVGDQGTLLSGGQRQRIAIARAILKDAPILILDEATSALDNQSERYIQKALSGFMKNRTTLIIAHRLSTIENADKIMVLDNGEIVEVGTHQSLIEQNGLYAKLHSMNFSE